MTARSVTVCLPTYNRADLLPGAIASVLEQDFEDLDLLVLDNHSTDETPELLAGIKDRRLRVVRHSSTVSMYANHNAAIDHVQSARLVFLHSDDRLLPGALRLLMEASLADPSLGLVFGVKHAYQLVESELPLRLAASSGAARLLRWFAGAVSGALLTTETLRRFPYDEGSWLADYLMMLRLLESGGALQILAQPTVQVGTGTFQASSGWHHSYRYHCECRAVIAFAIGSDSVRSCLLEEIDRWDDPQITTLLVMLATMGERRLIDQLEGRLGARRGYLKARSYTFVQLNRWLGGGVARVAHDFFRRLQAGLG